MTIALAPRLAAVAGLVLPGLALADVGTDHAYLPISLVQAGTVPRAIASDIGAGPLEAARRSVAEAGLSRLVEIRVGPGLGILSPGEAGTIVIAGMGGYTIRDIIDATPDVASASHRLVLQPMRDAATLRRWLWSNGWSLSAERLAREGDRYYTVIAVRRAQGQDPTDCPGAAGDAASAARLADAAGISEGLVTELGPLVIARPDPLLAGLIEFELQLAAGLAAEIERSPGSGAARERRASLTKRQQELQSLRDWLSDRTQNCLKHKG